MDLAEKQLTALNQLIEVVGSSNSFYKAKLEACQGMGGFESLEAFSERMPFTTKAEIAEDHKCNPPYGTNLSYPKGQYTRIHQTSGTTGQPIAWLDTQESWSWLLDNWKLIWKACGAKKGDVAMFPFSFGPFLGFWSAFEAAAQAGIRCIPAGGQTSLQRLQMINRYQPDWLCCTPTYALHLLSVAQKEGIDLSSGPVRRIIVGGEPGGSVPEVKSRIEEGWGGAKLFDHHGMTEVGPVTYSDPERPELLRAIHETYFIEVLDTESGKPTLPGDVGELILTTLGRAASPLIRYRTGDLVKPVPVEGEDPRAVAFEGGILGRSDDMVVVRGVNLYPSAIDAVIRSFDGIGEYQVHIDEKESMVQVAVTVENLSAAGDDELANQVQKRMREVFGLRIQIEIGESGSLPAFEMKAKRWNVSI
ncbi:MAG TPA: phenylacetate--CoA ligase [Opitutae bacterium]|nr:phenylacetate--CoA ligase [Opitutaceae bacterium]HCR28619.1 phenylacetate--CoA ligase [Opitutae bacterium]